MPVLLLKIKVIDDVLEHQVGVQFDAHPFAAGSFFRGNQDDAVGGSRAVQRRGRISFEYTDLVNIVGVDTG